MANILGLSQVYACKLNIALSLCPFISPSMSFIEDGGLLSWGRGDCGALGVGNRWVDAGDVQVGV